jgi:hypothetical protein
MHLPLHDLALLIEPDEDDGEAANIYVEGMVGPHGYRFLLDTGASRSCLRFDAFTATFTAEGGHTSSGVFARGSEDLITVPTLQVGPIAREHVTLGRLPEHSPVSRNLIGMDILQEHCCHFMMDEQRLRIDPGDLTGAVAGFHELLVDDGYHPYIEVGFGAARAGAVWDTGAGITVVDMHVIREQPTYFADAGCAQGTDATGERVETPMFTMGTVVIGNHAFPPHRVAGVDLSPVNAALRLPMDMILGFSTINKANWVFDFPRRRWAITKPHVSGLG